MATEMSTASNTMIVKPSSRLNGSLASHPRIIKTSFLDNLGGPVHISNHRFFHRPSLTFEEVVEDLKSALEVALEIFPPVAGTVRFLRADDLISVEGEGEKGAGVDADADGGRLIIDCDGSGVPFRVERLDHAFEDDDPQRTSPRPEVVLNTPAPALAVKVTQFSCGTIAVATSLHHVVADLAGFTDFLETWSAVSISPFLGERPNARTPSGARLVDQLDEDTELWKSITQRIPAKWTRNPQTYFASPSTSHPAPPPGYTLLDLDSTKDQAQVQAPHFEEALGTVWFISSGDLQRLKNDLSSTFQRVDTSTQPPLTSGSDSEGARAQASWISSSDALSALVWGALTRAREAAGVPRDGYGIGRSSTASGVETLAMAVDGRDRSLDQRMVKDRYFGNMNLLVQLTASRRDLLTPSLSLPEGKVEATERANGTMATEGTALGDTSITRDLSATGRVALAIRQGLTEQLTGRCLADRIQFFTQEDYLRRPGRISWSADCIATNWSKADLEGDRMAFRGLGVPFETTAGGGPCPPGFFRVMKKARMEGYSLLVWVEKRATGALKEDGMLRRYAKFVKDE